jgi:hypothetical protein
VAAPPDGDLPGAPPPWREQIAIAAASRFAALLPCPASGGDKSGPCEHVDLVLPPDVVQQHGPDTLRIELTVRIVATPTKAPSRSNAVIVSGCRAPVGRLQRLVLHVSRGDTEPVIEMEGERDAAAVPAERQ